MRFVESGDPAIERAGITAVRNFYPLYLLCELNQTVLTQQERKHVFDIELDGHFDEPIESAAALVATVFDVPGINKAILKKYEVGENSTAFDMHYDPEELQGGLFLSTLSGAATLTIASMNDGWVRAIRCDQIRLLLCLQAICIR